MAYNLTATLHENGSNFKIFLKTENIRPSIWNFITENTSTYANRNAFLTLEIANLASLPTI